MTMGKLRTFSLSLMAGAFLAGCQSQQATVPEIKVAKVEPNPAPKPKPEPKPVAKPISLNGSWVPTDEATKGVYVATFRNNQFLSKAPEGAILAKGNYKVGANGKVKLNFVGAVTKRKSEANCDLKGTTRLQCVLTTGSSFNLQKTT